MNKSPVVEGLIDEFYDDVDAGRNWLDQQGVFTPGLSHDELCNNGIYDGLVGER